jgi:FixJ family two-component response regulator
LGTPHYFVQPGFGTIDLLGLNYAHYHSTALNAGASAFFTKPFDDQQFLAAIRDALRD